MKYYGQELYHWGILGMKWGERRYQNEDGTYTEEGKARRRRDTAKYEARKNAIDRTRDLTNSSKNLVNKIPNKKSKNEDLSKLTNKDLQDYINRYNLEKQYKEITNSKSTNHGKELTLQILDIAGDVLSVAGSAAALYLSLRAIKGASL